MSPRGLAANASLALVGDAVAKGGMFAALLLLARMLPVGEFARLGVAMAVMLILTTLLDGGVGIVATREGAANPTVRLGLLHTGTAARLPLLALTALGCLAAGLVLGQTALALAVLVAAAVNAAQQTLFATFRSAQNLLTEAVAKAFCGISYPVLCAAAALGGHRTAVAAMLAMTIGPLLTLPPLYIRARRTARPEGAAIRPMPLLRRAAPFGLIALATLLYYRSPMLLMGAISTHQQTASYTLAANVAFGLLMVPAAIATGLLPRLAGEPDPATRARLVRHALGWSFAILAAANLLVGATAWALVPPLFGEAYRSALVPLLILLVSGLAIGAAGIFGTALIALDRRREIVGQVLAALAINLVAGVVLIPALAADGAALATIVTELVSLAFLAYTYARFTAEAWRSPPGRRRRCSRDERHGCDRACRTAFVRHAPRPEAARRPLRAGRTDLRAGADRRGKRDDRGAVPVRVAAVPLGPDHLGAGPAGDRGRRVREPGGHDPRGVEHRDRERRDAGGPRRDLRHELPRGRPGRRRRHGTGRDRPERVDRPRRDRPAGRDDRSPLGDRRRSRRHGRRARILGCRRKPGAGRSRHPRA